MSYNEWIESIEILKKKNDKEIKEKLVNEKTNDNLRELLEPKLEELIKYKFINATKKIASNLSELLPNNEYLDLYLVNFKKDMKFISELLNIKQFSPNIKQELFEICKKETEEIYNILIKKANEIDMTGQLSLTIKYNMFKWGE